MLWKRATPAGGFWGFLAGDRGLDGHVGVRPHVPRRLPAAAEGDARRGRRRRRWRGRGGGIDAVTVGGEGHGGRPSTCRRGQAEPPPSRGRPWRASTLPAAVPTRRSGDVGGPGARAGGASSRDGRHREVRRRGRARRAEARASTSRSTDVSAALRARRVQSRPHAVHRALREGQADGGEHVQRLVVAGRLRARDRRRQLLHQAEAGSRAQEPGLRPDAAARRRAVPVVREAGALGRRRRPSCSWPINVIFW